MMIAWSDLVHQRSSKWKKPFYVSEILHYNYENWLFRLHFLISKEFRSNFLNIER